jgi:hypothetical protein
MAQLRRAFLVLGFTSLRLAVKHCFFEKKKQETSD